MKSKQITLLCVALVMIGVAAMALQYEHTHQKLGAPAVKTRPLSGSRNLEVILPETVLNYTSKPVETEAIVTNTLPGDTSFGQRLYQGADGFNLLVNVVLMGTDRTSLHKPQFCLEGQCWRIDQAASATTTVPMERPVPYQLPVAKLIASRVVNMNGQPTEVRGVYVYYYVADGALSASPTGFQRMWWMARELMGSGVLQRWAYVTYFAWCPPGQENATFERMKTFIASSAPEFQLMPKAENTTLSASK